MPTGYTAGILDGTITTFEQFAKLCIRAFGATIHMREEPLTAPYEPATPSGFYYDNIEQAKADLEHAKTATDKDLIEEEKQRLTRDIQAAKTGIAGIKANKKKLTALLNDALGYQVPSPEYKDFKTFLVEQLTQTIQYDANPEFWEKRLVEYKKELAELNVDSLRSKLIEEASQNLHRAKKSLREEEERCAMRNKWVEDLFASLTPTPA